QTAPARSAQAGRILAIEQHAPAAWRQQIDQHASERGLAAARLSDKTQRLATIDAQADVAHRDDVGTAGDEAMARAKAAGKTLGCYQRAHASSRHLMQRDARAGSIRASCGAAALHCADDLIQRGANAQPGGSALGGGTMPGIAARRPLSLPSGALAIRAA